MHHTTKTYIKPTMRLSDLIFENPALLLLLEHFDIETLTRDKTVAQICDDRQLNPDVFIVLANLYNGFYPSGVEKFGEQDALSFILFLRNSHLFYLNEKIPEVQSLINELYKKNEQKKIKLIEDFFNEYANEVREHLAYEDDIAFPYFNALIRNSGITNNEQDKFSVQVYRDHHGDIETKLADLKNLLLRFISLKEDRPVQRKLLLSLFELESDLNIHSIIEEQLLMPLIKKIERKHSIE